MIDGGTPGALDGMTDTATRTFRGRGGAGLPNLTGLPGVRRLYAALPEVFETDRFDTDDARLAAAGITLGLHRPPSAPAHWRLDLPDETLRIPAGESPDVPAEFAELVRAATREAALRPVGTIRTVRTENRLLGPDDRLLATLVHDDVTVATMGRRVDARAWSEIDLRPVHDPPAPWRPARRGRRATIGAWTLATRSPTCAASRSSWSARTSPPTGCARSAARSSPSPAVIPTRWPGSRRPVT